MEDTKPVSFPFQKIFHEDGTGEKYESRNYQLLYCGRHDPMEIVTGYERPTKY